MPVLARSGGRVFFTATDGTTGYELWSLPVPTRLHTITPCRVADTRDPAGPTGGAPLASSETVVVQVTGRCGIPSTALSIAANVTVVSPSAAGSLSVFAGGPIVSGIDRGSRHRREDPGALNAIPGPRHRRLALRPRRRSRRGARRTSSST